MKLGLWCRTRYDPLRRGLAGSCGRTSARERANGWLIHGGSADRVGYQINFTRYCYKYERLRSVEEITRDILALDAETEGLLKQVLEI